MNFTIHCSEVLNKQPYTKETDIYSFGIIMWENFFGKPVSFEKNQDYNFKYENVMVCTTADL
ncbi:hypothetical protein C2G38_2077356 [Gigaspora rosea]|uniref:Serine-threonine/tyrosine-protein kinase catalytic domain-containing protein n=1 Tax=Gigaspora rosea TaxID=44941 RepID=A0A397VGZ9_9GLOM|nr:hypothetical protein C2G38_2120832 [Gigaspora rosea]RIB21755.1 hypothetical protein C2G38_2077356 [Gigaspora rosea]